MARRANPLTLQRRLTPRRIAGHPEPGFFKLRVAKKGPWVPALIWRPCPMVIPEPLEATPDPEEWCRPTERPRPLRATIGTRDADPQEVWTSGRWITPREYHWRLGLGKWAAEEAPSEPEAKPYQPVDLTRSPALF